MPSIFFRSEDSFIVSHSIVSCTLCNDYHYLISHLRKRYFVIGFSIESSVGERSRRHLNTFVLYIFSVVIAIPLVIGGGGIKLAFTPCSAIHHDRMLSAISSHTDMLRGERLSCVYSNLSCFSSLADDVL